jgi:hypothetical protein
MDIIDAWLVVAADAVKAIAPDSILLRFLGDGALIQKAPSRCFSQIMISFFLTLLEDWGIRARRHLSTARFPSGTAWPVVCSMLPDLPARFPCL